jgi:hypothetical protein
MTYTVIRVGADGYPISLHPKSEEFTAESVEQAAEYWFAFVVGVREIDPATLSDGLIHCRVTDSQGANWFVELERRFVPRYRTLSVREWREE